jgi:hypothetical protein
LEGARPELWAGWGATVHPVFACAQAGVRSGIVFKKDVFTLSVTTKSAHASCSLFSFLVPLEMCSEVDAGDFTGLVYGDILNVGKSVMKMTDIL